MKKYTILIIAIILGSFLRLWQISQVPNGFTWDEAALGYNAYSILKTGRDEHGVILPLIFKSFGDYKPGLYVYLTIPPIMIFGLNHLAVRFPSALAGILAILGIYLFVRELLAAEKNDRAHLAGSLSALMLALSPWHIHFSRGGWEVNVFVTLTLYMLYFLLRYIHKKSSLHPTLVLACLSLLLYQAAKMVTPLVFIFLIIVYWRPFWARFSDSFNLRQLLSLSIYIIFGLWIYLGSMFGSAGNRLNTLSIFNYRPPISAETLKIDGPYHLQTGLFHNQTQLSASLVASRYLWHFSPEVLFYEGPIISERGHIPGLGVLNPLELIWLTLGLIYLAKQNHQLSTKVILGLLLIAPLPASLTLAEFSTVRALFMVIPLAIISGLGLMYCLRQLKVFSLLPITVYLLATVYTFDLYFFHSQAVLAKEFMYGYQEAVNIIKENPSQKIVFTDVYGQPYIFYAFYTALDPKIFQQTVHYVDGGLDVGRVDKLGNLEFHQFGSSDINSQKDTLFIGTIGNIDKNLDLANSRLSLFQQIETPDHQIVFRIVKTKP